LLRLLDAAGAPCRIAHDSEACVRGGHAFFKAREIFFPGLHDQLQRCAAREWRPQRRGVARDYQSVAIFRQSRDLTVGKRLQESVMVDAAPLQHVAAIDQAVADLVDVELLQRGFTGVFANGLAVALVLDAPNVSAPASGRAEPAGCCDCSAGR
jgi:hypothetical protein